MKQSVVRVYTDGSCANDAGHYGAMSVGINIEGYKRISRILGTGTNVIAEYEAIIAALEELVKMGMQGERVLIHSDNMPVVNQLMGVNRVKSKAIRPYYKKAKALADEFRALQFRWVSRQENSGADYLSKRLAGTAGPAGRIVH